jgi:hypothetical protein
LYNYIYIYIVASRRTQITLTDRQYELLRYEAARSGLSMSELIRRSIDKIYRPHERLTIRGWEITAGMWRELDTAVIARRLKTRNPQLGEDL